jgi:predicted RNA binding protein YcfA (HicA-like mRNA interferase family)
MKKFIAVLLILTMFFTTVQTSFAIGIDDLSFNLITLESGERITEQELIEFLNNYDGEITKVSNGETNSNRVVPMSAGIAIPLWAIGEWVIPFIGTVIVTPAVIYVGDKVVKAGTTLYNNIIDAIDDIQFAKNNPTGRKVKDVHKRLKKEGFVKKKGTGGSHEQWEKGGRRVSVPNHGRNYDIPIGTLRNIWKQAGWK